MREWALPLLRCLQCGSERLESSSSDVRCSACGTAYARRGDVVDFLHRPHPAIVRERDAVQQIDREAGAPPGWMRSMLDRLERDELTEEDRASSAHVRAIADSREQVLDLLRREPLPPRAVVLEVGADVGWASAILLGHGCRVVATDITDHLLLSPVGDSPELCRLLADMNRLPIGDGTVDVVFAASCVHHSWDLATTFREFARVLKPAGSVYLCGEPLPSMVRFAFGGRFGQHERALGINETWIRRDTWLRECRKAGLVPRIVFPELTPRQLKERLGRKRLPRFLAHVVRPFLPMLQVSVHLRARKAEAFVAGRA